MKKHSNGFTLLETLLAITLSALILFGSYSLLHQVQNTDQRLEGHTNQMDELIFIKRILERDFQRCLLLTEDPFVVENGLYLKCPGNVLPNYLLGTEFLVHYQWQTMEETENLQLQRDVQVLINNEPASLEQVNLDPLLWQLTLATNLTNIEYEIWRNQNWENSNSLRQKTSLTAYTPEQQTKAIRWNLSWQVLEHWQFAILLNKGGAK